MRWKGLGLAAMAAALSACAGPPGPLPEQAAAAALAADRAFAAMSERQGPGAAFRAFSADDAVAFVRPDVHMRPEDWPALFPPAARLAWTPLEGRASNDGSIAWTWGQYDWSVVGADKAEKHATGRYLTIWRRQADGSWRFCADAGSPD
jgi:ketosteroid isomerase-like protein